MNINYRAIISSSLMISAFLVSRYFLYFPDVSICQDLKNFPRRIGEWRVRNEITLPLKIVEILKVNDYVFRDYISRENREINMYVGYFRSQRQGQKIHSPKHCMPGSGWQDKRYQIESITLNEIREKSVKINKYIVAKEGEKNLVFYWYHGRGRIIANEYEDRILLIWDAITKQRTDGALVRIIIPIRSIDEKEASKIGIEFIKAIIPILNNYIPS